MRRRTLRHLLRGCWRQVVRGNLHSSRVAGGNKGGGPKDNSRSSAALARPFAGDATQGNISTTPLRSPPRRTCSDAYRKGRIKKTTPRPTADNRNNSCRSDLAKRNSSQPSQQTRFSGERYGNLVARSASAYTAVALVRDTARAPGLLDAAIQRGLRTVYLES